MVDDIIKTIEKCNNVWEQKDLLDASKGANPSCRRPWPWSI